MTDSLPEYARVNFEDVTPARETAPDVIPAEIVQTGTNACAVEKFTSQEGVVPGPIMKYPAVLPPVTRDAPHALASGVPGVRSFSPAPDGDIGGLCASPATGGRRVISARSRTAPKSLSVTCSPLVEGSARVAGCWVSAGKLP